MMLYAILAVGIYAVVLPGANGARVHHLVRRALAERNLTDPGSCVQNCFIKQNRAVAEDTVPKVLSKGVKVPTGPRNAVHPAVRGCEIHNIATQCLKSCPASTAKSLYLDSILTESAQCNASVDLLKAQWDCVANESLVAEIKSCNSRCPSIPLGLTESIGLNPNAAQVVYINYESDGSLVEKDLIESCKSASCLWPCMKPIVEGRCGKAVSDQSNVINKAEIQSVVSTFLDLKVIKTMPEECGKFLSA